LQRRSACIHRLAASQLQLTIRLASATSFLGRLVLRHNQSEAVIPFRNFLHIFVWRLRPVRLLAERCTMNPAVPGRSLSLLVAYIPQAGVTFRAFRFRISEGDGMNSTATHLKEKDKTALITGASAGIGYELAKLFAGDHCNLVL